jgi:hypothetical protein
MTKHSVHATGAVPVADPWLNLVPVDRAGSAAALAGARHIGDAENA